MATEQQQIEQRAQTGATSQSETSQAKTTQPQTVSIPSMLRPSFWGGPFSMMDRLFESFFGRDFFRLANMPWQGIQALESTSWPAIEISQHGDKLEIHADVPGLRKEDVKVEVRDNQLSISGERHSDAEREEKGYYRSERSYGSFYRTIQLPEGANAESTTATFDNGVLTVEIDLPSAHQRGTRQIEVRDAAPHETRH